MNDNNKLTANKSAKGWLIIFIAGLFYTYQFMVRVSPNIMTDDLLKVFSIDAAALGSLIGVYYWGYSLMQLPLGISMDKISPRYFLCIAAIICGVSCFIFANTTSAIIAALARFMMGMSSACGLIGTIKLGTIWLDAKHIAKVTGITVLMGTAGAGLGGTPLKFILLKFGFNLTLEMLAVLGILVSFIIFISLHVYPAIDLQHKYYNIYEKQRSFSSLKTIIKNTQTWIIAFYGLLMYTPITIIGIAWGVSFVERTCHTSNTVAASVVSIMFLGAALGSPVIALISDYFKTRKKIMILGSVLTSLIWLIVVLLDNISLSIMYILFFVGGFAYTTKSLTFACICEIMPKNISATSIAFVNMLVTSTGIIFHPLIGNLIEYHWDGRFEDNFPLYTLEDYRFALIVIPISLILSGILVVFMHESHPESKANADSYEDYYQKLTIEHV